MSVAGLKFVITGRAEGIGSATAELAARDVADEFQLETLMSNAAVHVGGIYGRSLIGVPHVS